MKAKEIISGLLASGGWGFMLLSIVFYLLYWRVDSEPGAKAIPGLLWTAISLCSLGSFGVLGGNIYLLKQKSWITLIIVWVVCVALFVGAISLLPFLLLLMV